ncbi:MAG: hypothetical protein ACHQ9S_26610 [Candidatus Binatia bacterium]
MTERLTIRVSKQLAEALTAAAAVDHDESAFVRELLRRELLHARCDGASGAQR